MYNRYTHSWWLEGAESYDSIQYGFAPLIEEINSTIEKGVIEINNQVYELNFIIGGDYKVSY